MGKGQCTIALDSLVYCFDVKQKMKSNRDLFVCK